jgi:hypothetical protein
MGKKYKEIKIGNEEYIFTMLKPRISISLLTKIIRIIGPSLGKAFPNEIKIKNILEADINIGNSIIEFSNKLDDLQIQEIINILFTQVQHKGEGKLSNELAFNNLFSGKLKHLFKVVKAALEVQYADFLEGEDALALILQKSTELANQEQNQNTIQTK